MEKRSLTTVSHQMEGIRPLHMEMLASQCCGTHDRLVLPVLCETRKQMTKTSRHPSDSNPPHSQEGLYPGPSPVVSGCRSTMWPFWKKAVLPHPQNKKSNLQTSVKLPKEVLKELCINHVYKNVHKFLLFSETLLIYILKWNPKPKTHFL